MSMISRILLLLAFTLRLAAGEPTTEDLLRQGLFEEEANHDFDKATEHYRAVVMAHDRQRALAATATFRLGEIARKKNDRDTAAAAFRTVIERFPEQEEMVRISRENLAALGMTPADAKPAPANPLSPGPEDVEIARLKEVARNSPDLLDGAGTDGWRPLHHAAKNGWGKVMAYLLENKADPNSRTTKEQLTPLQLATIHGHLDVVKTLIDAKSRLNDEFPIEDCPPEQLPARDARSEGMGGKFSALDLAVLFDRREIARTLIAAGADLKRTGPVCSLDFPENHKPSSGVPVPGVRRVQTRDNSFHRDANQTISTLSTAIYLHRDDLAQELIKACAPSAFAGNSASPGAVQLAVICHPEMVAPLIKAGADPKVGMSPSGITLLHDASETGQLEVARLLIGAGADPKAADAQGHTPLHFAASAEMVDLLVSKGADSNAKDKEGQTPLDAIASRDRKSGPQVFEALLKQGATVADAKKLLQQTSLSMLPVVRERVAYPKEYRPDAILLSLDGSLASRTKGSLGSTPAVDTLDIRPAPGCPPPTLPEALCPVLVGGGGNGRFKGWENGHFSRYDNNFLESMRILRRDTNGRFETVLDWTPKDSESWKREWPALEWGDIVELSVGQSYQKPALGELVDQLTPRSVTVHIGGLSFPFQFQKFELVWLDDFRVSDCPDPIGNLWSYVDHSHISIRRKGVGKPFTENLDDKSHPLFRLVDGDVIDLVLSEVAPKDLLSEKKVLFLRQDFYVNKEEASTLMEAFAHLNWAGLPEPDHCDWTNVRILRHGAGHPEDRVDLVAWVRSLPPKEKWTHDELERLDTKLQPGDVVVLSPLPDNGDEKTRETASKTWEKFGDVAHFIDSPR